MDEQHFFIRMGQILNKPAPRICKFLSASGKLSIFFIFFNLLSVTYGDITITTAMEGESTTLNFTYPCDCARKTLRHGYKAPFYDSARQDVKTLLDHQDIIDVGSDALNNTCLLHPKIDPVLRGDVGGYILTFYGGGGNILGDSRIGLRVNYPPGKASCEWEEKNVTDDWGLMLCHSPAGNVPGQIACYQNDIRLPQVTSPSVVEDILQQTISVRHSETAFCCASFLDQPIDMCACSDYVWDPNKNGDTKNPCATPQEDSTTPQNLLEDISTSITTSSPVKETVAENHGNMVKSNVYISLHWGVLLAFVPLVLLIVVQCFVLAVAFQKIRQLIEQGKSRDKQNGNYKSVPTVDVTL
ncbi:uncharacterized protein LOC121430177 [Lytechinus variegatus]|uniref:uncharacterized protein LOC121430177 n=1 Tax=Lytechinus variegatus TaxID=7654 RepID=UPI001BB278A1|nr:uncharacterized protein LOC121430177 [Lytechinus variegatus]